MRLGLAAPAAATRRRAGRASLPWHRPSPPVLAGALVALVLLSEWKMRERSALDAAALSVDLQTLVEVMGWGAIGALLLWHLVRPVSRRQRVEGALTLFVAAVALIGVSSLYAPSALAVVRAVQWSVLLCWAALAWREFAPSPEKVVVCWTWFRRALWVTAVVAIAGSVVLGAPTPDGRYRWFSMHPIATANAIGLALVLLLGTRFALPEPLRRKTWWPWAQAGLLAVLALLLVVTRSRGALLATVTAVLVLVVLTPYRRHRAFSLVTLLGLLAVGLANVGVTAVGAFLARGQSGAQLQQLNGRLEIFEVGIELIGQRPLFGHGYLAGRTVFYDRIWWHPGEAHNVLLEIAVSMGLLGLGVFLALLLTVAGRLLLFRRRRPRPGPGAATVADVGLASREALAVLVFCVVNGMVAESFISPGYEAAALVLAIVLADCSWAAHRRHGAATVAAGAGAAG